ncbi:MAG: hypothetical protein O6952_10010 [Planctomycetota bacterium]|nr:hypothetical protein [Planctomycetota bacterium]
MRSRKRRIIDLDDPWRAVLASAVLVVLSACQSTLLARDPDHATIVYRLSAASALKGVALIVLTTEQDTPHLKGSGSGFLGRVIQPDEMRSILDALEEVGLGDLPTAGAPSNAVGPPQVTIESGGSSKTWVGRREQLGGTSSNRQIFGRATATIVNWARTTTIQSRIP